MTRSAANAFSMKKAPDATAPARKRPDLSLDARHAGNGTPGPAMGDRRRYAGLAAAGMRPSGAGLRRRGGLESVSAGEKRAGDAAAAAAVHGLCAVAGHGGAHRAVPRRPAECAATAAAAGAAGRNARGKPRPFAIAAAAGHPVAEHRPGAAERSRQPAQPVRLGRTGRAQPAHPEPPFSAGNRHQLRAVAPAGAGIAFTGGIITRRSGQRGGRRLWL